MEHKYKLFLPLRRLRITWAWFPVNMSTGAMASLLSQQPYNFHGLTTIAVAFYLIDLLTFFLFTGLIAARFARKPHSFLESLYDPSEGFFFGSFWVAIALLINGTQVFGVPYCGPWLVGTLRVLFWVYFSSATIVSILHHHLIFQKQNLPVAEVMPTWILPAYPLLVVGVLASAIATTQPHHSAVQILVGGIAGQGLGWILALIIYGIYMTRLFGSDMPSPSARPAMYVSVGPAAYTCAGILSLGRLARQIIPEDLSGIQAFPVGEAWYALSIPVALFIWLGAVWFALLSTVAVVRDVHRMHFTLNWWAFVFPNARLAIATISIGQGLNSSGFKIAGASLTITLVALWLLCTVMHVRSVWKHKQPALGDEITDLESERTRDDLAPQLISYLPQRRLTG